MLDPEETSFDAEDAFRPRLVNKIINNYDVRGICPPTCNIGFVILKNFIFFNIP